MIIILKASNIYFNCQEIISFSVQVTWTHFIQEILKYFLQKLSEHSLDTDGSKQVITITRMQGDKRDLVYQQYFLIYLRLNLWNIRYNLRRNQLQNDPGFQILQLQNKSLCIFNMAVVQLAPDKITWITSFHHCSNTIALL